MLAVKNIRIDYLRFVRFVRFLAARFMQDRCVEIAASLTFTTLLSLVPLVTIALTLFSAFPFFSEFSGHIKNFILSNMMPETGGRIISRYMEQFAESAAKLTAVGVGFLVLTAMLMMLTIDDAFNTIWRVSRSRTVVQRVLTYWAVLTLGPLLIGGSLSITSWLTALSVGSSKQVPIISLLMLEAAPFVLTTLAFSLLYRVLPNRYVPFRHAFTGGIVGAFSFELMNRAFAFYITNFPTYKLVYGAFASIPVFLMWIYLSWLTVLLGAVIAASLSHWRSGLNKKVQPAEQLYYALCILKLINEGMHNGQVQSLPIFSKKLHIGFDSIEEILDKLAHAKIVGKLTGSGWAMIRDTEHIQASELYELFIFNSGTLTDRHGDASIRDWLTRIGAHYAKTENTSLHELFNARERQEKKVAAEVATEEKTINENPAKPHSPN